VSTKDNSLRASLERFRDAKAKKEFKDWSHTGNLVNIATEWHKAGADAFIPIILELAEALEEIKEVDLHGCPDNGNDDISTRCIDALYSLEERLK